jgi:hypothetical protein
LTEKKVDHKVMGLDKFTMPVTLKLVNTQENLKFINTEQQIQCQFYENGNKPFGDAFALKVKVSY